MSTKQISEDINTVKVGAATYTVELTDGDLTLAGPRGAFYILTANQDGTHRALSLGSGPMTRKGNEVRFTVLGDLVEVA